MTGYESGIIAGIGGFVGMASALGYGFKCMVDVLAKQLGVQNTVIHDLESDIKSDLKKHIEDCKQCQTARLQR